LRGAKGCFFLFFFLPLKRRPRSGATKRFFSLPPPLGGLHKKGRSFFSRKKPRICRGIPLLLQAIARRGQIAPSLSFFFFFRTFRLIAFFCAKFQLLGINALRSPRDFFFFFPSSPGFPRVSEDSPSPFSPWPSICTMFPFSFFPSEVKENLRAFSLSSWSYQVQESRNCRLPFLSRHLPGCDFLGPFPFQPQADNRMCWLV